MNKNKTGFLPWAATILVMILIFVFSSRTSADSNGQSVRITRFICRFIFFRFDTMTASQQSFIVTELNFFIRKLAHFSIYMLLGICSYTSLLLSKGREINVDGGKAVIRFLSSHLRLTAVAICAVYASLDEIHQYFVPERTMRFTDVLIDSAGALTGTVAVSLAIIIGSEMIRRMRRTRHSRHARRNTGV